MKELRLFGSLSLIDERGRDMRSLLAQPRRLALLAYLATATPRGRHRRDQLAALFWTELDQDHARAALRQAVYVLRGALGAAAIESCGDEELSLDFELVNCDVAGFDHAVEAGQLDKALSIYRGAFLDGFFISDAPEFEQWVGRERTRFQETASVVARTLIAELERSDPAGAARSARRAVGFAPHDEALARKLISLLEQLGDRGGAMEVYRDLTKRLADVYEVEPSPETQALVRGIRGPAQRLLSLGDSGPSSDDAVTRLTPPRTSDESLPTRDRAVLRKRDTRYGHLWRWVAAAAVVLLLLGGAATGGERAWVAARTADTALRSIAILPVESPSGDSALTGVADAISEALVTDLGEIRALRVISRRATLALNRSMSPQIVERQLKVQLLVDADLRRVGDHLSIDVRLVDGPSGFQRWSERFEGSSRQPIALEVRIARRLIEALGVPLMPNEARSLRTPASMSTEAYDLFLRGKMHLRHETIADDSLAIAMLERAVQLDPEFAAAYALLARAYGLKALQFTPGDEQWSERAAAAADKSLQLDPDLAEAHYARGMMLWTPGTHWTREYSVREYRRALELNPNFAEAHHALGVIYLHAGLLDKAVDELEKTLAIDPGNGFAQHRIGVALIDQGKYEEGLRALRSVPSSFNPALWYYHVTWALLYLHRDDEASSLIEEYLRAHPEDRGGVVTSIRAMLRAKHGDIPGAERDIHEAEKLGKGYVHFHHTEYNIASVYALLNRPRAAVQWLRRAADDGWPCYPYFATDPNLDTIRKDSEFVALLADLRRQWEHDRATL